MPAPFAKTSSTNAVRTTHTSTPRCSATPAATPATSLPSVLRSSRPRTRGWRADAVADASAVAPEVVVTGPSSQEKSSLPMREAPEPVSGSAQGPDQAGTRWKGVAPGTKLDAMSETSPQGQTATPPPPAPQRLLRRATRDRWLGGVATGFARFLGIDPVLARVGLLVLGLILWWPILVLYVVCLFVIPADDAPDARNPDHFVDRHGKTLGIVTGVVLLLALLGNFDNNHGPWHPPWVFFVLLVAAPILFVV